MRPPRLMGTSCRSPIGWPQRGPCARRPRGPSGLLERVGQQVVGRVRSTHPRSSSPRSATAFSCRSQTTARPFHFLCRRGGGLCVSGCLLAKGRQRVETTTGPAFSRGDRRIFCAAREQLHLFQAAERPVERAVRRQQASVGRVGKGFGDLISVERRLVAAE